LIVSAWYSHKPIGPLMKDLRVWRLEELQRGCRNQHTKTIDLTIFHCGAWLALRIKPRERRGRGNEWCGQERGNNSLAFLLRLEFGLPVNALLARQPLQPWCYNTFSLLHSVERLVVLLSSSPYAWRLQCFTELHSNRPAEMNHLLTHRIFQRNYTPRLSHKQKRLSFLNFLARCNAPLAWIYSAQRRRRRIWELELDVGTELPTI